MMRTRVWLVLAASLAATRIEAQQYFGQNQVQYQRFDWKVTESDHFLVHYYSAESDAVMNAARMAERAYARLSRLLNHQFHEKKPIILFSGRGDFGQNNVTGDLGEGTGGVTEALRHRVLLPFTGDYKSFEHVLQHELVHAFQYDIFARGRAGNGLQTLASVEPPLWFMEGMAEYLSLGPNHVITQAWVRDASLNGNLPTIEQMTTDPQRFFPYRYGEALWEYIGARWGDDVIGEIMNAVPNVGIERAFRRELGLSLEDLSDEWREAMQVKHLPQVANLERARKFAQPLLTQRKSGGLAPFFIAPSMSEDGKYIAFVGYGSFLRGEVFTDLWLADGETGKRLKRLVKSTTNTNAEELRMLYSQSAFSPDGKYLAYSAMRQGRDVLYLLDVRRRKNIRRFDGAGLDQMLSPSWSPDGRRIAFSGSHGGITDLYVVDVDGKNLRQLTSDDYGDLQPQWSPDGKTIAFTSDRGSETNFETLRFSKWEITLYDLETSRVTVLPGQGGLNLNPMWAPDGKSIAYVSDRTGIPNIFLWDFARKDHFQLTNVVGAVLAVTEYSPAITWARQADRLAFVYYENGDYNVWSVSNPRRLAKEPYRDLPKVMGPVVAANGKARTDTGAARNVAQATAPAAAPKPVSTEPDSATGRVSLYRAPGGVRASSDVPGPEERGEKTVSVAQLLDSASLNLPDTTRFKKYGYKVGFQPEYISRPSFGYAQDNFGRGVFGGTTIVLGDLLGNNRLAFAAQVNGRLSEAAFYAGYMSMGHRLQYMTGLTQQPIFFLTAATEEPYQEGAQGQFVQTQGIARYIVRDAFASGFFPLNRFTRFEFGATLNNIDRSIAYYSRGVDYNLGYASDFFLDSITNFKGLNYAAPYGAYVSDNTLFGYTGPISGRRYRFQIEPTLGSLQWVDYQLDYRRYFPILFNFLTFAVRGQSSISIGRDELEFPKYIGRPDFVRGYDRERLTSSCQVTPAGAQGCNVELMFGSRVAFANAELRFPLVRRFDLGVLPISLPPVDGLFFYDAGMAWSKGQSVSLRAPENFDPTTQRYPLRSYGMGIRLNLFNFALVRWDYAIPLDRGPKKGYWTWTLGPSF